MLRIIKQGRYKLIETKSNTKILYLDDETFAWIEPPRFGELLVYSHTSHKADSTLASGKYKVYEVENEPDISDNQHLELEFDRNAWQGYLLLTGLPNETHRRVRIIPTKEVITGNKKYQRALSKTVAHDHRVRIKSELRDAGMTSYGLLKPESRHLTKLIHADEHIKAVVYGKTIRNNSAMIVATTERLLYLEVMPLMATVDELLYHSIYGISRENENALFATLTLHSEEKDYTIRFVNAICANHFVRYVEEVCISEGEMPHEDVEYVIRPNLLFS